MFVQLPLNIEIPKSQTEFNLGLMFRESLDYDSGMLFVFEEVGQKSFHMKDTRIPLDIAFIKEDGTIDSIKELKPFTLLPVYSEGEVLYALEVNRGWFGENNVKIGDQIIEKKGEKCSCEGCGENPCLECGGNCHKLDENVQVEDANGNAAYEVVDLIKPDPLEPTQQSVQWEDPLQEASYLPKRTGNIIDVYLAWRGKTMSIKMFFPSVKKPSRKEVIDQLDKVYPGAKLWSYQISDYDPGEPLVHTTC